MLGTTFQGLPQVTHNPFILVLVSQAPSREKGGREHKGCRSSSCNSSILSSDLDIYQDRWFISSSERVIHTAQTLHHVLFNQTAAWNTQATLSVTLVCSKRVSIFLTGKKQSNEQATTSSLTANLDDPIDFSASCHIFEGDS